MILALLLIWGYLLSIIMSWEILMKLVFNLVGHVGFASEK